MRQFTENDISIVTQFLNLLVKAGATYAQHLNTAISIESVNNTNDCIEFGGAGILMVEGTANGIIPKPCIEYVVHVIKTFHGGYFEPDYDDYIEIATCKSLLDAVTVLYLHLAEQYCNNAKMALNPDW